MKRKHFIAAVISVILVFALAFSVIAYADNEFIWEYDDDTKTIYIYDGVMPDYENSYSTPWNFLILDVENVVIENMNRVGNYAFSGAEHLSSVTLDDCVTSIGEYAFASCPMLTELTLGSKVTSIADYSFAYNGIELKDFTLNAPAGSYALHYIIKNNRNSDNKIAVNTEKITCGEYAVRITQTGGMLAYYPYTPKYSGTYKFYSTGTHDTRGYIYNSNYQQIAYNDDYGSSTNFRISSVSLTAGQTYYFGARIMNSSLKGSFDVFIEPVQYTLGGTIYAMNDPSGAASDIIIDEAKIDGEDTDGTYTRTVTEDNAEAVITVGNTEVTHTFSPDEDGDIVIMTCDLNGDGFVNGRDYAAMKTQNSKYKDLFANFVGYEV